MSTYRHISTSSYNSVLRLSFQIWVDLGLFLATLICAWQFQWSASDLIWGLWLSSLTVGYVTLIFGPIASGITKFPWSKTKSEIPLSEIKKELKKSSSIKKTILGILVVGFFLLFLFCFFTFHFGFFHYIHGAFLEGFFPLQDVKYPKSPIHLPIFAFILLKDHWMFVLASAVSQFSRLTSKTSGSKKPDIFAGPYKAVIRMHIMIFVFAGLQFIKADHFIFYAVILFAYFFPWEILRRKKTPTTPVTPTTL
jgi:hypothetical protein